MVGKSLTSRNLLSRTGLVPAPPLALILALSPLLTYSSLNVGVGIKLLINIKVLGKAEADPG